MTLTIIRGNGETGSAQAAGGRVQNAIQSASASTGVDFHYLYHQARIESGFNPNAQAKTSSASGLYQFTDQTWLGMVKQHGAEHGLSWAANAITRGSNGHYYVADGTTKQEILALRQSPETSAAMAGEYASDNQDYLKAKLGRDTSPTDLYMAHFLGPAGASRFLKAMDANPDAAAASVMPAAAHANKWVFYDKSGNPRSLADVYQRFASRFTPSAPASTGGGATGTPADSSSDLARMQLAALNGTNDGTAVTSADGAATLSAQAVLTPSPQTARLAYLMLASLGSLIPMATATITRRVWMDAGKGAILPIASLMLVALMVVPMPAIMLDLGFISNIVMSLAVLMVALNAARPLDFSAFPTVLLFTTLLRLSLNVASTRVVLVHGHEGAGAAGHVIEAFGSFLIGGNYAVGIFVFAIIMIINLVVITKGAGRVSEVSARFTLDAMPGKQMAIDADLNAGLLTPDEAKVRRQEVATEADFYGSMDGASKFVKGDAVAGVLVLAVNVLGGLILGVVSHQMAIGDAAKNYVQLAIGDALVAQIPALLLSIAAASIVTRVNSPLDLGGQISSQFGSAKAWTPVAAILTILGVLPGMPHIVILPAAALCGFVAWKLRGADQLKKAEAELAAKAPPPAPANPSAIGWNEVSDDAPLGLEIGYGLVALVDERKGAPLMARITGIRRQLSKELGFVVPLVRVRDDMNLAPNAYRITVAGVVVGEDECHPTDLLALDSGDLAATVEGRACKDPTFGLDAVWIRPDKRGEAVIAGYTVVDPSTVLATHLNQLILNSAADLFGMDEAQKLLDELKEKAPQLVSGLTPAPLSLAQIASLCRALLAEGVPLKDFRRVAEAMADAAREESDPIQLVEQVRRRIGALIVQTLVPVRMPLPVVTLDAGLESLLTQAVRTGPNANHPIEPVLAGRIVQAVSEAAGPLIGQARRFAIVTSPIARRALGRLLRPHMPDAPVLSFLEIPDGKAVEVVAVVGGQPAQVTQQRREPEMAR